MLLVRFAALLAWVVALPWLLARRLLARVAPGTHLLVEIDGPVHEVEPPRGLWTMARTRTFSLQTLRSVIDEMAHDTRVGGLHVVIREMRCGLATCASIRDMLARARNAGKELIVQLPRGGGTKETYVAAAADRIILGPRAELAPLGVLSATRYLRNALDRAGVVPEVHARGRYKTAVETLERRAMSDAQREQLDLLLDRIHVELVRSIAQGRRVDDARAAAIVDAAPYMGQDAVDAGLVDAVGYEDEVTASAGPSGPLSLRRAERYARSRSALRCPAFRPLGVIAVLHVHGAIASGSPRIPLGTIASDERILSAIRVARANPWVRGVVLHVDSPGGGALASDRIHHELVRLASAKPLVACMGSVAASGGYYVAAAAHKIIAQRTTITGSIGVIAARLVIDPLLQRLGIVTELLQRGAHAKLLDPLLPLGDEEKRVIEREVERTYRSFVEAVAQRRSRTVEEIEALAEGRVWSGEDAHARGLVDDLGGFDLAVDAVRQRMGRGADRLRVVVLKPPRKPVSWLDVPEQRTARALAQLLEPLAHSLGLDASLLALSDERVLAWSGTAASVRV
jgi:protease IV